MNKFNWKMVVAAVCMMFLSTACSKKLMPPEIETSSGGIESSDFTASNTSPAEEESFGGSGGPGDSGFFSEEQILEGSGSFDGSGSGTGTGNGSDSGGMAGSSFGSSSGPDGNGGNSMGGFGSGSQANIGNGSTGSFEANPFPGDSGNGGADSGTQEARLNTFHATSDLKDIHFNFDQFDLDSNSKQVLQENAAYLKQNPGMRVEIQGHCDERGTNNYNIALGERRAHSTKKFLVSQGVDSSRVNIISYGEEKPFCFDSNESCWFQNRRAHFMVAK
ncbi:MAG: peptidoglycan-associated lipoprotein Pal [Nitrospinae bacterium]|nr:peptidoglycan-associated lipoprotein Pal [Nitrospinota bacterium]